MVEFEYFRAASTDEAARMFGEGEDSRYLAGGQSLLPLLRLRLSAPTRLIDLRGIPDISGIRLEDGALVIGAMAPHTAVAGSDTVARTIPALAALAAGIGDRQVRNRGTIGGAVAHGDPAADYAAAVLALGATIRTDRRNIAADTFFKGVFETALEPGEVVRDIRFRVPRHAGYAKMRNPASGYPLVGVFVADMDDGVRVAVTGAAPAAFRFAEAERILAPDFSSARLGTLTAEARGLNADLHATPAYRAHLIAVMTRRAVSAAS